MNTRAQSPLPDDLPVELLESWMDGALDDAGQLQLAVFLSDPTRAGVLLDEVEVATLLSHALRPQSPDQLAHRVRALMAARRPERQTAAVGNVRRRTAARRLGRATWRRFAVAASAAAAVLLVAVLGGTWSTSTDQRVQVVAGSGESGSRTRVQVGDRLDLGTSVVVDQPLTVRWPDASTLTLSRASRIRLGADGVWIDAGRVEAEVMPRTAAEPFRVRSTVLTVTVIGTRFSVDAAALVTTVAVTSGTVRVTNQRGEERLLQAGGTVAAHAAGWVVQSSSSAAPTPVAPNTLTAEERAAGWISLFDGTTLTGWRGFRATAIAPVWVVRDGSIQRQNQPTAMVDDLASEAEFGDFDLRFEWRLSAGGNSGVLYRARSGFAEAHDTGPEYQVVDALRHPDGRTALTWPASCYAVYAPPRDLSTAPGTWNRGRIVVRGAQVEHWLNETLAVRYTLGSDEWLERVARSKFVRMPRYGREARGRIILQDHGDEVAYRSLKLLPFHASPQAP